MISSGLRRIRRFIVIVVLSRRTSEYFKRKIAVLAKVVLKKQWDYLSLELFQIYSRFKCDLEFTPPESLQVLLIVAEDHRYFLHPGFDVIAICRAIWRRLAWGVVEGASTIEQQLVRVLTRRYERTIPRKVSEILLSTLLTGIVPKRELPALYLYIAYYGWRMNGIKQACQRLNIHLDSMTKKDSASLVARLKYPEPKVAPYWRVAQIGQRCNHIIRLHHKYAEFDSILRHAMEIEYETIRGSISV